LTTATMRLLTRTCVLFLSIHRLAVGFSSTYRSSAKGGAVQREEQQEQSHHASLEGPAKLIVHWKGEGVEGYSMQFRHLEFRGAIAAVLDDCSIEDLSTIDFQNALNYTGQDVRMDPESKRDSFNQAMQYIKIPKNVPLQACVEAARRSSLIHALYLVAAEGESYQDLGPIAMENGSFDDMKKGAENSQASWCVRARYYQGEASAVYGKNLRYGGRRTRSTSREKEALQALEPLLAEFGGRVNLKEPDEKIYIFDGLTQKDITLARRLASGPRVSMIAPNTRICITNTPLCPLAAFTMCNVAGVRPGSSILDPYAGSGAILLAASMIEPTVKSVGIEIAHDGLVNRDNIRKDFVTRGLNEPVALIQGDSTNAVVRENARSAIGGGPFDLIITDPPYGIRESTIEMSPVKEMLNAIANDRKSNRPLLRVGGKLVCFLPFKEDQEEELLPSPEEMREAGLECETVREQPLNSMLSRWLVSFVCVE
jgi:tRNA G10  N-methylase Trm11